MRTIFECETEIGRCDDDLLEPGGSRYDCVEPWTIFAHTTAALNGSKRMLKIEQRCYLRRGLEILDQPWVRSEMALEPVLGSEAETAANARCIHEQFVRNAREQLPHQALIG